VLADIFSAFREAPSDGKFAALQDKIAEYAGQLVTLDLTSVKDVIDILMKLDTAARSTGADDDSGNERQLQQFLRGNQEQESA
jgi:hypothetical protein